MDRAKDCLSGISKPPEEPNDIERSQGIKSRSGLIQKE